MKSITLLIIFLTIFSFFTYYQFGDLATIEDFVDIINCFLEIINEIIRLKSKNNTKITDSYPYINILIYHVLTIFLLFSHLSQKSDSLSFISYQFDFFRFKNGKRVRGKFHFLKYFNYIFPILNLLLIDC